MSLADKIQNRMQQLGISPKRSLGQNFLISDHVVEKILAAADPSTFDQVIEIGPGLGAITDEVFAQNNNLTLIELDQSFAQFWRDQKINVEEINALEYPWKDLSFDSQRYLLVSNLPYQISSRLVVDLSLLNPSFNRMVLMFQKEVAQRLMAEPGSSDYGLLTVVAQTYWHIQFVLEAGSVDFHPKPNVASRVLKFDRKDKIPEFDSKGYMEFVKKAFANRRKKLLPKLTNYCDKDKLKEIFTEIGLSEDIRVEKLDISQFLDLYRRLKNG